MKKAVLALTALTLLAGCNGAQEPSSVKRATTPTTSQAGRSLQIIVNAPNDFLKDGKIISDDVAGVISAGGGNVISAGGGNVITAGGGNVISAGGGNFAPHFSVQASLASFALVQKAGVQLEKLDGTKIGPAFTSTDKGAVSLSGVPDGEPLRAVAHFVLNGVHYRMSVPIAPGSASMPYYADPINTMVEAALNTWLGSRKISTTVDQTELKHVWDICNAADITLKPDDLKADAVGTLMSKWDEALQSPKVSTADKADIDKFKASLAASN